MALRPGRSTRRTSKARSSPCAGSACPYPHGYENPLLHDLDKPLISAAQRDLAAQAGRVAAGLTEAGLPAPPDREIVALIAYLQRLGTDIKAAAPAAPTSTASAAGPATGGHR